MKKTVALGIVVLVLGGTPDLTAGPRCTGARAKDAVRTFIRAYNDGDLRTLDRLFATDAFYEYRVNPIERPAPASEDRATLMDYFAERHAMGDRLKLVRLRVGRAQPAGFYTHATVERTSEEGLPWSEGRFVPGKSGVDEECEIRLWRWEWRGP